MRTYGRKKDSAHIPDTDIFHKALLAEVRDHRHGEHPRRALHHRGQPQPDVRSHRRRVLHPRPPLHLVRGRDDGKRRGSGVRLPRLLVQEARIHPLVLQAAELSYRAPLGASLQQRPHHRGAPRHEGHRHLQGDRGEAAPRIPGRHLPRGLRRAQQHSPRFQGQVHRYRPVLL